MVTGDGPGRIRELRRALTLTEPGAFLVEPRVIRRVIRELHGFVKLSPSIPHTESHVVDAEHLRQLVHPDELGLETFQNLAAQCILICQPEEGELEHWPVQELLQQVWRRLFHAVIDRELLDSSRTSLLRSDVQERIAGLGQVEFDEAHFVLRSELRLVDPDSRMEAWREFTALYLELKWFEPDLLPVWFPSLAGQNHVDEVLSRDVHAAELFRRTMPYGATVPDVMPHTARDEASLASTRRDWTLGVGVTPSDRAYLRMLRRRDRANERGNTVGALVCSMQAGQHATSDEKRLSAEEKARADIRYLVERLRRAINFAEDQTDAWQSSLWELATNAIHGFWNSEKRLLFDLQKVCLDHERVTYKVDLVTWIVSRFKRPIRRPLGSLREVMMANHLASAASRLVYVRLSGLERDRLTGLLHRAAHLSEVQMRERMRPVLQKTLQDVQLIPENVPENVAFDKLVDDALDSIADRGYLTMGYLRDSISKNDLKLPDLTDVRDLWRGDYLLRADDRLDVAMDGVYRRGEFYLRLLQTTSSVFFGNRTGRFTTLFLIIPFGGAVVIVEGFRHIAHMLHGKPKPVSTESVPTEPVSTESVSTESVPTEQSPEPAPATQPELQGLPEELAQPSEAATVEWSVDDLDPVADEVDSEPRLAFFPPSSERDTEPAGPEPLQTPSPILSGSPEILAADSDGHAAVTQSVFVANARPETEPHPALEADRPVELASFTSSLVPSQVTLPAATQDGVSGGRTTDVPQAGEETTVVEVEPHDARDAIDQIVQNRMETAYWVVSIGFLLMALIHLAGFRKHFLRFLTSVLKFVRQLLVDYPLFFVRLPIVQKVWRHRQVVKFRRFVLTPGLLALGVVRGLPWLLSGESASWGWFAVISVLFSMALNSRLGRDTQEVTAEWIGNAWHKLRARVFVALFDFVLDGFRMLLNFIERFIYAVDEWLRFHSDESWPSIVTKAILGVIWSFVSFLIRIYVNLLIEPTFHPVKHFPVVTVAHKMILPGLFLIQKNMVQLLQPYLGLALAESVTWFNIFFIPGIFGFAVWELKENWRLYASNRRPRLLPMAVGSHGETVARLLRPGFHSGTLPKLFRKLRRLEHQLPSFRRFSARRAARGQLEHVEVAISNFVARELIRLLELCPVWKDTRIRCGHIHIASNSFYIDLECAFLGEQPLRLLFQEQSGWVVASVADPGCLRFASADQIRALQNALEGFYRKCGIDMVREQMEDSLLHGHPYDINGDGLIIWPHGHFRNELFVDLNRKGSLRPVPAAEAISAGLASVDRGAVLFFESQTDWHGWVARWTTGETMALPNACQMSPRFRMIAVIR